MSGSAQRPTDLPPLPEMTSEQAARIRASLPPVITLEDGPVATMVREANAMTGATDPDACDCGHGGMGWAWHLRPCPVKEAHL